MRPPLVTWPDDQQFYMSEEEAHENNNTNESLDMSMSRDASRDLRIEEFARVTTRAVTTTPQTQMPVMPKQAQPPIQTPPPRRGVPVDANVEQSAAHKPPHQPTRQAQPASESANRTRPSLPDKIDPMVTDAAYVKSTALLMTHIKRRTKSAQSASESST